MSRPEPSPRAATGVRTLATLGIAVLGPVTLVSGLLTFATIPTGVPRFLVAVFVFAAAGTALCAFLYLMDDARRRG